MNVTNILPEGFPEGSVTSLKISSGRVKNECDITVTVRGNNKNSTKTIRVALAPTGLSNQDKRTIEKAKTTTALGEAINKIGGKILNPPRPPRPLQSTVSVRQQENVRAAANVQRLPPPIPVRPKNIAFKDAVSVQMHPEGTPGKEKGSAIKSQIATAPVLRSEGNKANALKQLAENYPTVAANVVRADQKNVGSTERPQAMSVERQPELIPVQLPFTKILETFPPYYKHVPVDNLVATIEKNAKKGKVTADNMTNFIAIEGYINNEKMEKLAKECFQLTKEETEIFDRIQVDAPLKDNDDTVEKIDLMTRKLIITAMFAKGGSQTKAMEDFAYIAAWKLLHATTALAKKVDAKLQKDDAIFREFSNYVLKHSKLYQAAKDSVIEHIRTFIPDTGEERSTKFHDLLATCLDTEKQKEKNITVAHAKAQFEGFMNELLQSASSDANVRKMYDATLKDLKGVKLPVKNPKVLNKIINSFGAVFDVCNKNLLIREELANMGERVEDATTKAAEDILEEI